MELIYHQKPSTDKVRVSVVASINGNVASFGVSRCGRKDRFVRKIGRERALKRALNNPILVSNVPEKEVSRWFLITAVGLSNVVQANPQMIKRDIIAK